nr:helix-turn-helix transcriptional regulator [Nocardia yunnanensis]
MDRRGEPPRHRHARLPRRYPQCRPRGPGQRPDGPHDQGRAHARRLRRLAELAAQGLANKEIAARLYLSPRTIEDHLSRILRKLGLTSRAGIALHLAALNG